MKNISIPLILGALCSFTAHATETPCFRYEADIPLSEIDSRLGFSGNDMIRNFNNASQNVSLTWEDGTVTTAHLEFTPDSDSAGIFIADYGDECSGRVADLDIQGQLALKTNDGRIDATWISYLWRSLYSKHFASTYLNIEPHELQGIPLPLEGEVELTYLSLSVDDNQLYGEISRLYENDIGPIINEDGSITLIDHQERVIAVIGNQIEWTMADRP